MQSREIERAVANRTGESLAEIRRRGFQLADPIDVRFDPEPPRRMGRMVDWDALDAQRLGLFP